MSFLASPKLLILATNSVPARTPALRFWVQHLAESGCQFGTRLPVMGSWSKATAGTGLTIRSSRDRFAASCKSANFHLHKAAKRPGLTQALDRSRNKCRSTSVRPSWRLFSPRLPKLSVLTTNSVPARAAGTPFLGSTPRKERSSVLDVAQARVLGEKQRLAPV